MPAHARTCVLLFALTLGGCATELWDGGTVVLPLPLPDPRPQVARPLPAGPMLVLPVAGSPSAEDRARFQSALVASLAEPIDHPAKADIPVHAWLLETGAAPLTRPQALQAARERGFRLVLEPRLPSHSPYPPLRLQVELSIWDAKTGSLVCSFQQDYDSRDEAVSLAGRRWFRETAPSQPLPFSGSHTSLERRDLFIRFVATHSARVLKSAYPMGTFTPAPSGTAAGMRP